MKMMLTINMMMNLLFILLKHPLSMGMIIILQTTLISMMTGMMYKSFWFSFILFLMFVSGMMVLFIYMTSLIPNMMFSMNMKMMMVMMSAITMSYLMKKPNMMMNNDIMKNEQTTSILINMYTNPMNSYMMMMALYLLYTMITVFKITEVSKGPLRKLN
uniref:NADH dehydrogenase subunit 6 n=1 Tax=Stheneboea repudiosa TaxID=2779127 RepID=UPI0025AA0173|nr:NADH dehydrogenase subunit 6 [Stheneboea repudiosa]WID87130.1 NADH dehydrogenase subunit 6 [Stheneboea repudiosa]